MCNPNLLVNWDFRNPVNQRGQTSYILGSTKYEYCLDMCAGGNLTVTIHDGYVNLKSDKNEKYKRFSWRREPLPKGTYTISARIKVNEKNGRVGLYYSEDLIIGPVKCVDIPNAGFEGVIQFIFTVEDKQINWCGAEIVGQNTTADYYDIDIYDVKLEVGTFSTLANEVVDYATELRKCQRYLQVIPAYNTFRAAYVDNSGFKFNIPIEGMRINPSLSGSVVICGIDNAVQVDFIMSAYTTDNMIVIVANKNSHGLKDAIFATGDKSAILSAEL